MNLDCEEYGGTVRRTESSKFVVSLWHIPNGCDYDRAVLVKVFFDEEEGANRYAKMNAMPPEMADAYSVEFHDDIARQVRENQKRQQDNDLLML